MKTTTARFTSRILVALALTGCDPAPEDTAGGGYGAGAGRAEAADEDGSPATRTADVFDDFARASGELGHTPVGGYPWRVAEGDLVALDGALATMGATDGLAVLDDLVADDFSLTVRVRLDGPATAAIVGLRGEYRLTLAKGELTVDRGDRTLGDVDVDLPAETWATVSVVADGPDLQIGIDGRAVLALDDPDGPSEGGFAFGGTVGVTFDDLEVFLGTVDGTSTGADPAGSPPGRGAFAAEGGDGDGGEGGARSTGGDAGGEGEPDRATPAFAAGGSGGGTGGPPPATDEDIRALAAPAADLTTPTTLYKMTRFLFDDGGTGTAEQVGADLGVLVPSRISLVHGFVRDAWGEPLDGVDVWAVGHPEFGTTTTRADGSYDFVVTGGLPLALALTKDDYLTAHRRTETTTGDSHRLDDTVLLQPDAEASLITFTDPIEVHHAFTVNDGAPDRMATLMFRQGTQATMVFGDQTTQPLTEMTIRLTEFTVGSDGPHRMPAPLPAGTIYNYALEISADEAEAAGAVSVELDTPAVLYVGNFLAWDVGTVMPSGTYDRAAARWAGEPDGIVIEVVGVDGTGPGRDRHHIRRRIRGGVRTRSHRPRLLR